jgi:hypothetical protein
MTWTLASTRREPATKAGRPPQAEGGGGYVPCFEAISSGLYLLLRSFHRGFPDQLVERSEMRERKEASSSDAEE